MPRRFRVAIGMLVLLVGLGFYIAAAAYIGDKLQSAPRLVQMAYFVIAGFAWFLPLKPFVYWMNRVDAPKAEQPVPKG